MKYLSLIRRRHDVSREAFRDYYERIHAPLALTFFPPQLYQRNHLDEPGEQAFDCLSEFVYPDDFDPAQVLETEAGPALAADERNFMDRDSVRTARATLLHSHLPGAAGPRQREMWMVPEGVGRDEVAETFARLLPRLAAGQGGSLEWLEPWYCEQFPFAAVFALEGAFDGELPQAIAALGTIRLRVSSCPSPHQ